MPTGGAFVPKTGPTYRAPVHPGRIGSGGSVFVLTVAGIALTMAAGVDLLLAWIPLGLGNPEWEFGTVSATLNGLPLLTVGIVLVLHGAVESRRVWAVRTIAAGLLVLTLVVLAAGFIYATDVPMAFKSVNDPIARSGLLKAVIKAFALVVVFAVAWVALAIRGWRSSARRRS